MTAIQLRSANEQDYHQLHAEMAKEAFTPVRAYKESGKSLLNAVEFKRTGNTLNDINSAVFRATARTGKKYAFTVMKEKRF